jgi:hypothetical protein
MKISVNNSAGHFASIILPCFIVSEKYFIIPLVLKPTILQFCTGMLEAFSSRRPASAGAGFVAASRPSAADCGNEP